MHPKVLSRYAAARQIPEGEARREIEATLADVAAQFASFRFGSHERQDMAQQAALFGWEALCRDPDDPGRRGYDADRPLRNFLSRHVKNRLHNFKRDTFLRPEAPCPCCDPFDPPPEPCAAMRRWEVRNGAKQALARAGGSAEWHDPPGRAADDRDMIVEVDRWADTLAPGMRADYLRMRQGATLPKGRREAVRKAARARFGGAAG